MKDTAFHGPQAKLDRFAKPAMPANHATQELTVLSTIPPPASFSTPPVLKTAAPGWVSTADDFNAFAQMMLNGVPLGKRPHPVAAVGRTDDHRPTDVRAEAGLRNIFLVPTGWGMGLSVFTGRDDLCNVPGRFGWDGGYGTSWYSDPTENLHWNFC